MGRRVSAKGSSIITRLVSRSQTEPGLQIQVHQHFGYRLHLLWRGTKHEGSSEMCMEKIFLVSGDVQRFCTELEKGALEGLCSCAIAGVVQFMKEKGETCFIPLPSEIDGCTCGAWIRDLQEHEDQYRCCCRVSSSCTLFWD
jgi:hypothetical protein